ncbi:MAG: hypothetical protein U1F52_22610 [Burkholderiales bacterium]
MSEQDPLDNFFERLDAMMADTEGWKRARAAQEAEEIRQGQLNLDKNGKPVLVVFPQND